MSNMKHLMLFEAFESNALSKMMKLHRKKPHEHQRRSTRTCLTGKTSAICAAHRG